MPCWHFMACLILKIGPKTGKIAYFHKNVNISKSRQRYLLLVEKCQKPEIWPSCTQKQYKEKFLATFSIFDSFAEIWGAAGQKSQKIENFGLQRPRFSKYFNRCEVLIQYKRKDNNIINKHRVVKVSPQNLSTKMFCKITQYQISYNL